MRYRLVKDGAEWDRAGARLINNDDLNSGMEKRELKREKTFCIQTMEKGTQ